MISERFGKEIPNFRKCNIRKCDIIQNGKYSKPHIIFSITLIFRTLLDAHIKKSNKLPSYKIFQTGISTVLFMVIFGKNFFYL